MSRQLDKLVRNDPRIDSYSGDKKNEYVIHLAPGYFWGAGRRTSLSFRTVQNALDSLSSIRESKNSHRTTCGTCAERGKRVSFGIGTRTWCYKKRVWRQENRSSKCSHYRKEG